MNFLFCSGECHCQRLCKSASDLDIPVHRDHHKTHQIHPHIVKVAMPYANNAGVKCLEI